MPLKRKTSTPFFASTGGARVVFGAAGRADDGGGDREEDGAPVQGHPAGSAIAS